MNMLRFPKRRTPWLTACLFFNTLLDQLTAGQSNLFMM
jgi:hypothetical protein